MEMTIQALADNITKVNLAGRFDLLGARQIDLHFNVVLGNNPRVIVDLEHVPFLASMGIRTLVMGAKAMKTTGGRMVLLKPNVDVETVLIDSGTDTIIPIVHDLEGAIAAVTG